ncbi:hypothetical protein [Deinococcus marmoris]|uniref:hypothetical protein n=1 Tax=Deinococcus marmoris TaxID=249408 RepID=UPI00096AC168|nr:hypothetical protein [Deinococcus marmoris]
MKKYALLLLAGLTLSACGSAPGQVSGSKVSVGVSVNDARSVEVATKTVTPATEKDPAKVSWAVTPGSGVTFTFMTRPGSDAVYLRGYRILSSTLSAGGTTVTRNTGSDVNKIDVYLTSGYSCPTRTALDSCSFSDGATVAANGLPASTSIYLEGGLGDLVVSTNASATLVTNIEFFGQSSNGQVVTVQANGIVSAGSKQGDN